MRRERGELPSSSSPLFGSAAYRETESIKCFITSRDRNWNESICCNDFRNLLNDRNDNNNNNNDNDHIEVLDISVQSKHFSCFICFATLSDLFKAIDRLQGIPLEPRFPNIFLKVTPHMETIRKFGLGQVLIENIPFQSRPSTIEKFITQTVPRAEFIRGLIPFSVTVSTRNRAVFAFAYFRSVQDADECVRALDNRLLDPDNPDVTDPRNPRVRMEVQNTTPLPTTYQATTTSHQFNDDDNNNNRHHRDHHSITTARSAAAAASLSPRSQDHHRHDQHRQDQYRQDQHRHSETQQHHHPSHSSSSSSQQQQEQQQKSQPYNFHDDNAARLTVNSVDGNWNKNINESDFVELFKKNNNFSSGRKEIPAIFFPKRGCILRFNSIDDALDSLQVLQGVPLPRFPDIFLKAQVQKDTKKYFNIRDICIRDIPRDTRASEIESFITQTFPRGPFIKDFIPFSVSFLYDRLRKGVTQLAFACFRNRNNDRNTNESVKEAVEALNGEVLDRHSGDPVRKNKPLGVEAAKFSEGGGGDNDDVDYKYGDSFRDNNNTNINTNINTNNNDSSSSTYLTTRRSSTTAASDVAALHRASSTSVPSSGKVSPDVIVGALHHDTWPRHLLESDKDSLQHDVELLLGKDLTAKIDTLRFAATNLVIHFSTMQDAIAAVPRLKLQPAQSFQRRDIDFKFSALVSEDAIKNSGFVKVFMRCFPITFTAEDCLDLVSKLSPRGIIPELAHRVNPSTDWREKQDPRQRMCLFTYDSLQNANRCVEQLDGFLVDGDRIEAELAKPRLNEKKF